MLPKFDGKCSRSGYANDPNQNMECNGFISEEGKTYMQISFQLTPVEKLPITVKHVNHKRVESGMGKAGLAYHQLPTQDNCLFHVISDQLIHL